MMTEDQFKSVLDAVRKDADDAKREYHELVRRERRARERWVSVLTFVVVALTFPYVIVWHLLKRRKKR